MDLNKLPLGAKLVAGSGLVFLISMFVPWWGLDIGDLGSALEERVRLLPDRHGCRC